MTLAEHTNRALRAVESTVVPLPRREHPRVLAAARLDAIAATVEHEPHARRELEFLAMQLAAADADDARADVTAAAVLGRDLGPVA